jgi:hypothetical protein
MELIESKTLGTAQSSIEFTSIPQDGTDLVALMSTRSTRASGSISDVYLRFNGSTSGYSDRRLTGDGSSASPAGASVTDKFYPFDTTQATFTSNTFGSSLIYIPNYTAAINKSISSDHVTENNATFSVQTITAGLWSNTAAITSITFSIISGANYEVGTTISLYKITKGSDGIVTTS